MGWTRITIKDMETGEEECVEIKDDYALITDGKCELTHTQLYPTKGTHILTIKGSNGEKRVVDLAKERADAEGA